jgi:hypothetical protein
MNFHVWFGEDIRGALHALRSAQSNQLGHDEVVGTHNLREGFDAALHLMTHVFGVPLDVRTHGASCPLQFDEVNRSSACSDSSARLARPINTPLLQTPATAVH